METEGVKNISVLKIFDYLMLHEPPNWPSVQCRQLALTLLGMVLYIYLMWPLSIDRQYIRIILRLDKNIKSLNSISETSQFCLVIITPNYKFQIGITGIS